MGTRNSWISNPLSSVENIFNGHNKTPFADTLQKELAFRLVSWCRRKPLLKQALEATVGRSDQRSQEPD